MTEKVELEVVKVVVVQQKHRQRRQILKKIDIEEAELIVAQAERLEIGRGCEGSRV